MPKLRITVPEIALSVSGLLEIPSGAHSLLILAHGAGAGMLHSGMSALAEALHLAGVGTLRFQFPYREKGSKRPDQPPVAVATIAAAVRMGKQKAPQLPLFAGGRSFGGRMATTAASQSTIPAARGIVCFGFPLHPAKKPGIERAEHLTKVSLPMLFIQGTRDELSDLSLLRPVVATLADRLTLVEIKGADHGYGVLKSSGRTANEVLSEVAQAAARFCRAISAKA